MKPIKILVIEDSRFEFQVINQFIDKVFIDRYCKTTWTKTFSETHSTIKNSPNYFDLILTDLSLPDIEGIDVVDKIKKICTTTPLIVLSGSEEDEDGLNSLRKGADDYLAKKNITFDLFKKTILYSLERFKLHQQVQASHKKAKDANRAKSDFLSNMSHEIRTPLNLIVGTADLLSETDLDQTQTKYVDTFKKASDHLVNLINDILDYSKIESGNLNLSVDDLCFQSILEDVASIVSARFRKKKIAFKYSIEGFENCVFSGDRKRIFQILLNCISNAFKFTDKGFVEICIKNLNVSKDKTEPLKPVGIEITISDSGRGISSSKINKIFENFYQIDNSSIKEIKGTGLGLSIVNKLVHLMSGSIKIESVPKEGTQFIIYIPLKSRPRVVKAQTLVKKSYLILSPIEDKSHGLGKILTSEGASVTVFSNANSFIEHQAKLDFSIYSRIFLDVTLPIKNGIELMEIYIPKKYWAKKCIAILPSIQRQSDLEAIDKLGIDQRLFHPLKRKSIDHSLGLTKPLSNLEPIKKSTSFNFEDYNILVVDDDPDNRDIAFAYLKETGCIIDLAKNGFEALTLFDKSNFDLILMDIQMPGMDGYMTAEKIRQQEEEQNLEKAIIIGLSANSFSEDIERARLSGFNGYISKPVKKAKLLSYMAQFLLEEDWDVIDDVFLAGS